MTLEKAIKIKLQWRKDNYPLARADETNADMLSIEALKRFQRYRRDTVNSILDPLPGETIE